MTWNSAVVQIRWGLLLAITAAPMASAQSTDNTPPPAANTQANEDAAILEPSQGRPIILQSGDQFRFLMRIGPGIEGNVGLALRHARVPSITLPLSADGRMTIFQKRYASLALSVPDKTAAGLYDLVLRSRDRTLVAQRSIRVVDTFKTRFRFVHLSDMTIGDPSAPAFDGRLIEEINLLAPEFIIATGDFNAWGRALDDPGTWKQTLDYLARFDAPVYITCGDQDHQPSFVQYVAQSPVGTFDYGLYHGLLLLEHAWQPLDPSQVDFIRRDLDAHTNSTFNIIVSHDDGLALFDQLAPPESLAKYLSSRKVRMYITGGSDDWDRKENAAKLEGLDLHYIRTHQASTCLRGRASGVSHYRVVEVDGTQVSYIYPSENTGSGIDHSIPIGGLRVFSESQGTSRVELNVQNALNRGFDNAHVWANVAKTGATKPEVAGGKLVQALDGGDHWVCQIAIDLPDKGGVRVVATTDGALPPPLPLAAELQGPTELAFQQKQTDAGMAYFKSDQKIGVVLRNSGAAQLKVFPTLRLNGTLLPITADGKDQWPIDVAAGAQVELTPKLILGRLSPGEHLLQLMYLDDPVRRVTTFPVTLGSK